MLTVTASEKKEMVQFIAQREAAREFRFPGRGVGGIYKTGFCTHWPLSNIHSLTGLISKKSKHWALVVVTNDTTPVMIPSAFAKLFFYILPDTSTP